MKLRMSVASPTPPPLDLFEALVLGVGWLIGIPGVCAGGATSFTCGRGVTSFNLVGAWACGGKQDQRLESIVLERFRRVKSNTRGANVNQWDKWSTYGWNVRCRNGRRCRGKVFLSSGGSFVVFPFEGVCFLDLCTVRVSSHFLQVHLYGVLKSLILLLEEPYTAV